MGLIERQTIVTWTKPEKKPEPDIFVVLTVSAKTRNVTYDHALTLATWGMAWQRQRVLLL